MAPPFLTPQISGLGEMLEDEVNRLLTLEKWPVIISASFSYAKSAI